MMEKKTKYIWYIIAICCLILFSLILIASLIDIGERLRQIHISVEIVFYVLCAILIFFGISLGLVSCSNSASIKGWPNDCPENLKDLKAAIFDKKMAQSIAETSQVQTVKENTVHAGVHQNLDNNDTVSSRADSFRAFILRK